uniref:Uncharacterized protein n=1 Tax=Globodera rostochiensis TaxID=31243 RepID=A0A914IAQ3_GLORO
MNSKCEIPEKDASTQGLSLKKLKKICKVSCCNGDACNGTFGLRSFGTVAAMMAPFAGIHCKTGTYSTMGGVGYMTPKACPDDKQFCYGIICSINNWEQLHWGCSAHNSCDDLSVELGKMLPLSRCRCQFGEKGVNLSNEAFIFSTLSAASLKPVAANVSVSPQAPPITEGG